MRTRNRSKWSWVALLIGLMAWTGAAQEAPHVDDSTLLNAGKTGDQWLMAGGNYEATRYSPLTQIDSSNVSRLGLAWYYDTDSFPGTLEASPVISNGILYGTVTWGAVFAVDARTGKEKWTLGSARGPSQFSSGIGGKSRQGPNRTESLLRAGKSRRRGV